MVRIGTCEASMNALSRCLGVVGVGVETEDDAGRDFEPVAVEGIDRFQDRQRGVLLLAHMLERIDLRRLDADEHGLEFRLAHQREDFALLGEVERGLAGEPQRDSRARVCQAIRCGSISRAALRLPMKLSSTK